MTIVLVAMTNQFLLFLWILGWLGSCFEIKDNKRDNNVK